MSLPPAPICRGCKGKYPVPSLGDSQCEICSELFKVGNLVWGPRFPAELQARALRLLRNCYVELLQEADGYYWRKNHLPGLAPEDKGSLAPAPSPPAPTRELPAVPPAAPGADLRGVGETTPEAERKKDEDTPEAPGSGKAVKPRGEIEKEKARSSRESDQRRVTQDKKGNKRRVREESPKSSRKEARVEAVSSRGPSPRRERGERSSGSRPVPVKEEAETSEEEGGECSDEGEEESPVESHRSKSPLPRRSPPAEALRPRSPPGPPPSRWVGPIPAGRHQRPPYPDNPIGLAAKSKPKRWKNKGRKKVQRQAQRRAERAHRGGWRY